MMKAEESIQNLTGLLGENDWLEKILRKFNFKFLVIQKKI